MPATPEQLLRVQDGKCFLCGKLMRHYTKEHVHPRATSGHRMENNIVLAHGPCNQKRGCTDPTEDMIARATEIYAALGLKAFTYLPSLREKKLARKINRQPTIITDCHGPEWQ